MNAYGYKVELAMNKASIQTLEVLLLRISCQFVIEFLLNLLKSSRIVIVEKSLFLSVHALGTVILWRERPVLPLQ